MGLLQTIGNVAGTVVGVATTVGVIGEAVSNTDVGALRSRALAGDATAYQQLQTLAQTSRDPLVQFNAAQAVSEINARRTIGGAVGTVTDLAGTVAQAANQVAVSGGVLEHRIDPSSPIAPVAWVVLAAIVFALFLVLRK
jgi:hypothetical protein